MARRLFFVPEIRHGLAILDGDLAHHLTRVLRVEAGQRYEISDNDRLYLAEIETARKAQVVFRVIEPLPPRPEPFPVTLLASLFKFDHFEWMLEKATELGVAAIQPVIAERSDFGLEKAAAKRAERWRRILVEASQQSRRRRVPELAEPLPLDEAPVSGLPLLLDELPGAEPLLTRFTAARPEAVSLLLGPEGGWTDRERTQLATAGWHPVSLGPLVLRAETAAAAALATVQSAALAATAGAPPE